MAYTYDTRQVTHGISKGAYAEIVTLSDGSIDTTIVPKSFTGLITVSFETSQDNTPFYADNVEHIRLSGAKSIEGTLTCFQFSKDFATNHLGVKESSNTMLLDTGSNKNFIFQFIETISDDKGNTKEQLTIYYNVGASAPTAEATTDQDSVSPKEFEIPVVASPNSLVLDESGNSVTYATIEKTEANQALFDLAYNQIILPSTAIPTPPPPVPNKALKN